MSVLVDFFAVGARSRSSNAGEVHFVAFGCGPLPDETADRGNRIKRSAIKLWRELSEAIGLGPRDPGEVVMLLKTTQTKSNSSRKPANQQL